MKDNHWTEYYEGKRAYDRTKRPDQLLPYWNEVDAARAMQWREGWEAARREDDDGGDDDFRGGDNAANDNRSNQMNPNNSAYHSSRGR